MANKRIHKQSFRLIGRPQDASSSSSSSPSTTSSAAAQMHILSNECAPTTCDFVHIRLLYTYYICRFAECRQVNDSNNACLLMRVAALRSCRILDKFMRLDDVECGDDQQKDYGANTQVVRVWWLRWRIVFQQMNIESWKGHCIFLYEN